MRSTIPAFDCLLATLMLGCGDPHHGDDSHTGGAASDGGSDAGGTSSGATGGATGGGGNPEGATGGNGEPCDDPLRTGLVAEQTGVSVDAFDCEILASTAEHAEPDPMLIKAIIYVESRFDQTAIGCPNFPCGQPSGWSAEESGCLGLMQVVPACGRTPDDPGMLSDGHPNMTIDPAASGWAGSIFNPHNNIELGVAGIAGNREEVEGAFPGCTEEQYTVMAIGNYNRHGSTTSCTSYNTDYVAVVLEAYTEYSTAAGYTARQY